MNIQKCAIIGCGAVGATIAYTLIQTSLFSELVLIDIDPKKSEGEAMDLNHGVSFTNSITVKSGTYKDLKDAYIIIIAAGAAQKPDQSRLDLVKQNVKIFKSIIPQITQVNTDAIILVVSNPVDILTYTTLKLSKFPTNQVIGSGTVIDTSRLKYLLGEHLGVDSKSVHAFIIGEHGDSELAVWSSANVSGIDLNGFCNSSNNICDKTNLDEIYTKVKSSAYKIIESKGATYYAIGLAATKIVETIIKNKHAILPVSCFIDGQYGLSELCLGIPAILGSNGVEKVLEIPLNDNEKQKLCTSAKNFKRHSFRT